MKKYWDYLKYVLEHKKNVFIECWKRGLYIHAFTHDLSKFSPIEFISYAKYFYGTKEEKAFSNFDHGWLNHQRKNKHHWGYWVDSSGKALIMPQKYIKQMICDWEAMGRKFGDTAKWYYLKNKENYILNPITIIYLERELGLQ
jgi:hypothetical protein